MIPRERVTFLLHNAPRLFGRLLEQLILASLLPKSQLSREATEFRQQLIDAGLAVPGDPLIGSMLRSTIHSVIEGQRPTYGQVWIWLEIIKNWYNNPQMKADLRKHQLPIPTFDKRFELYMRRLALQGTLEEIDEAYEHCKNIDLLGDRPIVFQYPSTTNLPNVRQKLEQDVEYNVTSLHDTGEMEICHLLGSRPEPISENYHITDEQREQMRKVLEHRERQL